MASAAGGNSAQLLHPLLLLLSTCFLLLPLSLDAQETNNNSAVAPVASPPPALFFSFNFSNASSYDVTRDIYFEGNASPRSNLVDLTCSSLDQDISDCTGRMSYKHPVPLYDDTTMASFSTSFTFVIQQVVDDQGNSTSLGAGIAFFLSDYPSSLPPDSGGDYLGLLEDNVPAASGAGQFVAVEFGTNSNSDNVGSAYLGIGINTNYPSNQTDFPSIQALNGTWTATVKFNNITSMLVASFHQQSLLELEPVVVSYVLPDVKKLLPPEVAVGFSAATGDTDLELNRILAWSFNSTLAPPPTPHKGHEKTILIIVGGVLALVVLVVVIWFAISCWKWTNRDPGFQKQRKQEPTRFEYRDLAAATDHFSEGRKLGEGHFGVVHRGYLKEVGHEVAVKEIKPQAVPGLNDKGFYDELNAITSVKHKNLVKLVGWCRGNSCSFAEFICWCQKNENNNRLFLVYELVPQGNLHDHLHKEETLPWETRYKIVKDITSALLYLHHECDPFILHRDIKPSNILLDNNFNAKLADFGLSRVVDRDSSRVLTIPVGTEAYLDPECKKPEGKVEFSRSTDIYSYGIVLLEIACGKGMVREQVWQHYISGSLLQAADYRLNREFNKSEMEGVIILGLWCSFPDSKKRPSMEQVTAVLEHGKPLPDLDLLDRTSVPTQLETYIDPLAPSSAGSSKVNVALFSDSKIEKMGTYAGALKKKAVAQWQRTVKHGEDRLAAGSCATYLRAFHVAAASPLLALAARLHRRLPQDASRVILEASLGHQLIHKEKPVVFLLRTPAHELSKVGAVSPAPAKELDEILVLY
ncbi:hypothetical protein U9M48_001656 [Paspalum notatum var. saurae]|uniref:Protein kinase domain-containing protein n=1 Tax=Paspalum notatum var. saurae TaxID=547442 RepID=A0AAQ3SJ66_PASNO